VSPAGTHPEPLATFLTDLLDFFENTTVEVAEALGDHFDFPEAIEWVLIALEDHISELTQAPTSPGAPS
jgi:hypothetical protein